MRVRARSTVSSSTSMPPLRPLTSIRCRISIQNLLRINPRLLRQIWGPRLVPITLNTSGQRLDKPWRVILATAPSHNRLSPISNFLAWETGFPKQQIFTRLTWNFIIVSQIRRALFQRSLSLEKWTRKMTSSEAGLVTMSTKPRAWSYPKVP